MTLGQLPSTDVIPDHYLAGADRLATLVGDHAADSPTTPVAACPGWSVHDVLAHLVGVAEDATAGRLAGPPTDEQTAAQVASRRDMPTADLVANWQEAAPRMAELLRVVPVVEAFVDVITHEQDIRTALGTPVSDGQRDPAAWRDAAAWMAVGWGRSLPKDQGLVVHLDAEQPAEAVTWRLGAARHDDADHLTLRTSTFEFVRARLGRRSPAQVRALDWSGDPQPAMSSFFLFGPREDDLVG